ncbi:M56 family metallopeptidase [uncultured Draconibacterium sp.]|uniref:M56 family metallopeptidase n=1 Tax=uncultured Draconibacterium sp. TaxID=1573823 RepID=UPI0029C7BBEE|nr:M56 family metallopeptidase [uncultured Draconibacterium sp.]
MNPFLAYLLKSSISLALLYVVFKLSLSRDKMHTANRFVLIGILLTSVILPFADIPVFSETQVIPQFEVIHEFVTAPQITAAPIDTESIEATNEVSSFSVNPWLLFYLTVIGLLVIRLAFSVGRVWQIIRRAEKQHFRDVILAIVKDLIQPFSFLQHIILSEKDFTENKDIVLAHEYAHIQHKHSVDLMICELFTALYWFNPFMWLLRRDLKLIHEYQADQAVLNKGIDAKTYQLLVLKKAVGERRFAVANHFTQKPILKRIKMMHMKNNRRWTSLKLVLFVPVVALLLQAFARPEIIVEKAGAYLPVIGQQDSSEVWIDSWVSSKMNYLKNEDYFKDNQPLTIVDSNQPINEVNTIHKKNVFIILQNLKGELLVENQRLELKDLRTNLESFLKGRNRISGENPDVKSEELPFVGEVLISQGTILFRKDVATPQDATEVVMKKIAESILSVRQETAHGKFENDYFSLSTDKKAVVNQMVPGKISFQIPKGVKRTSKLAPPPPPPPAVEIIIGKDGNTYVAKYYLAPKIEKGKWQLIENKKVSTEELKEYLLERIAMTKRLSKEINHEYHQRVKVAIEVGAAEKQVNEIKELIRSLKINHVKYSSDQPESASGAGLPSIQDFEKYDVKVYPDRLKVFNEECTMDKLKEKVEKALKPADNKESISVLSFSNVPKERLESVLNELNQIPFRKISTTVLKPEPEPVSTVHHKILLKADGSISMDEERYNLKEFESRINEIRSQSGETNVALEVENDVTYLQTETVLNILRRAKINQVGSSIQRHSIRETEPGTKIGEPSYVFGYGWNGSANMAKLKREAESFLSGPGNRSLYASITPDKNSTQDEIDAVKNVLREAGFLKVDVQNGRN